MKMTRSTLLTAIGLALSGALGHAEKGTVLKPALAKPGKAVLEEKFDGTQLGKIWMVNKGDWQIKDGAVTGKEKKEDQHPAVLLLNQPNHNSIIQFSFRLEGVKGFNLSYNHAKGHLFRIVVGNDGLSINKDKDKKDAKSKAAVLGKAAGKFEPGRWYTMLVEVKGDKVSVQTDNGVKLEASNRELDVDKTGYRFVTTGASLLLDDLKVWQAE